MHEIHSNQSTLTRQRFIRLVGHQRGYEDSVHYVAADAVVWVEQGDAGNVRVRFDSGDELIVKAEPIELCRNLEAMLTQRVTHGGNHA